VTAPARPDAVTLDDLADPRFGPEAQQIRDGMAAMAPQCPLEPAALLEAARQQAGVDDFGAGPDFFERLEILTTSLREEGGLSPAGQVGAFGQLTGHLRNRLLVTDLLKRHPEIHDERIERPIIICGLPRTGTTHLHNLVAADPNLRSLPFWESLHPATSDPRAARDQTAQALQMQDLLMPHFKRMHEMTVDHVHEEIHLLALDLSTMLFETMGPLATWRDHYLATDQTPSYEYLKTVLKALQWQRDRKDRWVLKSPQHFEQLPVLRRVFPDATYVLTHRDPVSVTASMATMIAYGARLSREPVDPHALGRYWADAVERLLRAAVRDRDVLPADQSIDVRFHEFMADDMATVERVYDLAHEPLDRSSRAAMADFLAAHPRGRHGTVVYDLDALGIDRDERRTALDFYVRAFGVAEEE